MIAEPTWLSTMKSNANKEYSKLPVPQEREEEWRYTELDKFNIDPKVRESEIMLEGGAEGVVFTDFLSATRDHAELLREHLGSIAKIDDKFAAFHYANLANGVLVFVPDGKEAKLSSRIKGSSHTLIITGKDSRLDYTEEQDGNGFSTDAVEIIAGEGSTVNFLSLQKAAADAKMFSFKKTRLGRGSTVNLAFGSVGSGFHRVKSDIILAGEGASCETLCAFKENGSQHTDFMINARHEVPDTYNNILAKGTLDGKSTSVFRGNIQITKDAQRTNSFLGDHTLLLSNEALANSIPSLKIDANDVKATHGASVGQLDHDQLFYLMSRGLSEEEAQGIIVEGFFEPLINRIKNADMQEKLRALLVSK